LPATDPAVISVTVKDASTAADVLSALSRASIQLAHFSLGAPSLDDVFFSVTGHLADNPPAATEGASS
jgi:ABC-2 type transport system ATP-binding protein